MEHRTNRVLTIVFAALFVLNIGHLLMGFASIPVYYERVTTLTIPPYDNPIGNYPTNESVRHNAATHNMTLGQYAVTQVVYHSSIVILCMVVALLLILRAGWNWFAWYTAVLLAFIAEFAFFNEVYTARLLPLWMYEIGAFFWPLVLLYFFLFPNGKPTPRRALWIIAPILLIHSALQTAGFILTVFPNAAAQSVFENVAGPGEALIIFAFLFILGCQLYRYRRVSTREEKQQTKWFLYGFVFFIGLSTLSEAFGSANPFADEASLLIFVFLPLSIGIAILRYRLFDIDILIRRTLIYSIITAMLALFYFGSVALLQNLLSAVSGQRSEIAIIVSTLAIAALFNPLRHRVQDAIDHRFYRRKYDAQKVLERFAATARDEVELEKLTGELLNVVNETMQPTHVSLWLKKTDDRRQRTEG